jgi:hypothetical protein
MAVQISRICVVVDLSQVDCSAVQIRRIYMPAVGNNRIRSVITQDLLPAQPALAPSGSQHARGPAPP